MGSIQALDEFKQKVDVEIKAYLDKQIRETAKRDALMAEALRYVRKMALVGGKRLRPAFMYYGYLAGGGRERERMIRTAVSIELIHIFLLIHDDIIDQDNKRHGVDTMNFHYEKFGRRFFKDKDPKHFGSAMAIIIGDMVGALGNQIIFDSGFKAERVIKALHKLQSIVAFTVIGQAQDIFIEYRKKAAEKEVLSMYENKTAKYSIEGPLHLGAALAGAPEKLSRGLSAYSIPLGVAFQVQDDILGIFGSEKKLGKKIGADIAEGKQTLLVVKAKEKGNRKQREMLERLLGKKELSPAEIESFREIIRKTGALDYAKNLSDRLVRKSQKALAELKVNPEAKNFLGEIAEYMVKREL